jgi:hypothetical protein
MPTPNAQLSAEQGRQHNRTRLRETLIAGFWILVLAVSLTGWLVALGWIAYRLIMRLVS